MPQRLRRDIENFKNLFNLFLGAFLRNTLQFSRALLSKALEVFGNSGVWGIYSQTRLFVEVDGRAAPKLAQGSQGGLV